MPTGLTSAWGYPINTSDWKSLSGLTYQLGMTSNTQPFLNNASPMTAFGRTRRMSKKLCRQFLKNKSVNPLTTRKIKRSGKTFKMLMQDCEYHSLVKKKKKLQKR